MGRQKVREMSWKELIKALDYDTSYSSRLNDMVEHWAHQEIVRRVKESPCCDFLYKMVEEMKGNRGHWWAMALYQIFNDGPEIPEKSRGVLKDINKLWLDWLKKNGYID